MSLFAKVLYRIRGLFNNYTVVISRCFDCSLNFAPNRQRNKAKYDDKNTNAKPGDQRTNKYIKDSLNLLHLMVSVGRSSLTYR